MNFDAQTIIVLLITAAAGVYVARWVWRSLAGKPGGCGSCSTCPVGEEKESGGKQLVSLSDSLPGEGKDRGER